MIATRPAEFDRKMGYEAMRDLLETYPKGQIDCVVCGCDETGLGALQAIKEAKRDELIGALISTDAIVEYLEAIDKGEAYMTVECTPYFGLTAFEYGIRYLNGEDIPPRIMLPQRVYIRDGDPKKAELLKAHIKYCRDNNLNFVPVALGGQDVLWLPELDELYPKPWYEDPSVFEGLEPFTTY
jgi:ABC-type sugar transport system substrate-binding protein